MISVHGDMRYAYKILVGKPEQKRPFRRLRYWWEDCVKVDLKENERVLTGCMCLRMESSGRLLWTC